MFLHILTYVFVFHSKYGFLKKTVINFVIANMKTIVLRIYKTFFTFCSLQITVQPFAMQLRPSTWRK